MEACAVAQALCPDFGLDVVLGTSPSGVPAMLAAHTTAVLQATKVTSSSVDQALQQASALQADIAAFRDKVDALERQQAGTGCFCPC